MKFAAYQIVAVIGSLLLMGAGFLRFVSSGNPKELVIGVLYLCANILIFCF